jgi:SPP1 gp7 family putative phage head morphogenesis protein
MQHTAVQLGQQAGMQQLQATVPTGVKYSFGVPHPAAIANIVGVTQAGSPLADLFNGFGEEAANGAAKALIRGVSMGSNPRAIARDVEDALGVSRARALTVCRTESLRAYRSANQLVFQQNSSVVKQWRWTSARNVNTCPACLAMDGSLHDLDEDMGSHPNCRCTMSPVTADLSDILGIDASDIPDTQPTFQSGSEWLDEQDESTQREVLGNLYDGWANGDFTLNDVVKHSYDADWGHSISVKPLKALVK